MFSLGSPEMPGVLEPGAGLAGGTSELYVVELMPLRTLG